MLPQSQQEEQAVLSMYLGSSGMDLVRELKILVNSLEEKTGIDEETLNRITEKLMELQEEKLNDSSSENY
jgi:hypothetical protein